MHTTVVCRAACISRKQHTCMRICMLNLERLGEDVPHWWGRGHVGRGGGRRSGRPRVRDRAIPRGQARPRCSYAQLNFNHSTCTSTSLHPISSPWPFACISPDSTCARITPRPFHSKYKHGVSVDAFPLGTTFRGCLTPHIDVQFVSRLHRCQTASELVRNRNAGHQLIMQHLR